MKIIKVQRPAGGQKAELTVEMDENEAQAFLDALESGELAQIGIKSEGVSVLDDGGHRSVREILRRSGSRPSQDKSSGR